MALLCTQWWPIFFPQALLTLVLDLDLETTRATSVAGETLGELERRGWWEGGGMVGMVGRCV